VDDLLTISEHPKVILADINSYFKLKPELAGSPDLYLGAKLRKTTLENGVETWCNSSHQYVQEAIRNTEKYVRQHGAKMLRKKTPSPMESNYQVEMEISPILSPERERERERERESKLLSIPAWDTAMDCGTRKN
jgi:hypothetical protein